MAIFGNIHDIAKRIGFDNRIVDGLTYLMELTPDSFSELTEGDPQKISLDGDRLFAINQVYRTKPLAEVKFEGHRKYIDLQYVFDGFETIQSGSLADCRPNSEYNENNDVQFFTSSFFSSIALKANMVCLLYPEDIHAPGLILEETGMVKKSVVKVLMKVVHLPLLYRLSP